MYGKSPSKETKFKLNLTNGTTIYLYSLKLELLETFTSSRFTAKSFNSSPPTILKFAKSGAVFKDKYILLLKEL